MSESKPATPRKSATKTTKPRKEEVVVVEKVETTAEKASSTLPESTAVVAAPPPPAVEPEPEKKTTRAPKKTVAAASKPPQIQLPDQETIDRMIQEAAYYLAEKRNFATGFEDQDWLAAKEQILEQFKDAKNPLSKS
jgi:outer membrane biosynthesis protein TonB